MAADHGAINLSQGFPDFNVSEKLISLVSDAMLSGHNQYAPMAGLPDLRKVISHVTHDRYLYLPDPETEITITAGATEALFATIMALIQAEDEVIVFDPAYDSYDPAIRMAGGIPVHLTLKYPGFHIDWDEVRSAISDKTRLIMINTPHNPTGSILSHEDLKTLETIALQYDLFILSDEVYEHIIFDGHLHESVLRYDGLRTRSIAVSSFGKTFHATGWKVGYLVAPEYLTTEIRKVHQFVTFSVSSAVQHALAGFLKYKNNYVELASLYQQKRDYFLRAIAKSRFEPLPSSGTYFQLLSYTGMDAKNDVEMAELLTREHGIASIPVSVFYKDGTDNSILRFCFAKQEETLTKAAEILCKI